MRLAIALTVMFCFVNGSAFAQKASFVSITEGSKTRVGVLLNETATEIALRDLKDGTELRLPKALLKRFEKGISDDAAIRTAGLPAVMAFRVAETVGKERPVGKVAQVQQNVIYVTLGSGSGLIVGQKLDVYRLQNEIRDPVTDKVLGVERPKLGTVEVTEINKEFSKVKLSGGLEITVQKGDEVEPVRQAAQVAVLPFRSEKGETYDVAATLAEDLTTQLVRQGVTVLERSVLDRVIVELAIQNTVLFEPENVQKLGQLAGASSIVTGKIVTKGKLGTAYARLIDVRTGKIEYAASSSLSLANANVVSGAGDAKPAAGGNEPGGKPAPNNKVKRRPVPKGAFQSDVVEFTDNARPDAVFKLARVGTQIWSDRGYAITALPKEIGGGALVGRDSEQGKEWLDGGTITALKDCTVYAIMRSRHLGGEEIGDVTIAKFLREGWEEVDGNFNVSFPSGENWKWKIVKKSVSEGDVFLQLDTIKWNKIAVLFVFK
ncbi:MAG: FlgO family outer membrane protein [Planctomycetaceae bacterium]|nr:FlgO family outer membrane protein [Planctomycetaceae bacterium]